MTIRRGYARILPTIASVSAFLNNTPVVVVFIPIIKQWASRTGLPLRKFLIPLSYAAILGGMCTLIGTSTNLVVHGMMLEAGLEGFTMFELGKVGIFIAIAGTLYMIFFAAKRLPGENAPNGEEHPARNEESRIVEAVLGPRSPASTDHSKSSTSAPTTVPRSGKSAGGGSHFPPRKASRSVRETRWCSIPTEHSFAHGAIRVSF